MTRYDAAADSAKTKGGRQYDAETSASDVPIRRVTVIALGLVV